MNAPNRINTRTGKYERPLMTITTEHPTVDVRVRREGASVIVEVYHRSRGVRMATLHRIAAAVHDTGRCVATRGEVIADHEEARPEAFASLTLTSVSDDGAVYTRQICDEVVPGCLR